MTNMNNNARHMNQYAGKSGVRGRVVALALAGVLSVGGVGAFCVAGLGKAPAPQAPVATQAVAAKPATKASAVKKAVDAKKANDHKKAEAKKAEAAKAAEAKKAAVAKQAEVSKKAAVAKQAEATKQVAKQTAQAAPKQAESKALASSADNSDLEAKVSREECIAKACAHVGAGGQAKGEAKNVTARKVVGGGTVYYAVELDLGDVHYSVNVDADNGSIICADQVHAGTRVLLDKDANPVEGTEQEA